MTKNLALATTALEACRANLAEHRSAYNRSPGAKTGATLVDAIRLADAAFTRFDRETRLAR